MAFGLMFTGFLITIKFGDYHEITNDNYTLVPGAFIMGLGVLVFIMASMGCRAACQDSRSCFTNKAEEALENGLDDAINHYGDSNDTVDKALDELQRDLQCCGSEGPSDWAEYALSHSGLFPDSCCKDGPCFVVNVYQKGCSDAMLDMMKSIFNYVIWISAVLGVYLIFGMICTCCVMQC